MTPNSPIQSTLGALRWSVPSATQSGVSYEVAADPDTGALRCNCLAAQHHVKPCWHVKAVASGVAGKPKVRYQPKPAPRLAEVDDLYPPAVPAIPIRAPRW